MENGYVSARTDVIIRGMHCHRCIEKIKSSLADSEGLRIENLAIGSAEVIYDPYLLSWDDVCATFREIGYPIDVAGTQRKNLWTRFLDRMISANKKSFGNKRLDCCDLNK
ncbi:hypothetical protein B4O97_02385 [Marispirochaeta aestuarii]|uniref:Uncharacterized protein n=1 Tax=Marispirochaeta aestuarii TaxID=1963862 RepID=A0A1Y1S2C9_9SPIO|nr:heavy metal-associated domain-containing protein [Marispirochaeta aestuarii]ORC37869.1 hypothetical protein B4O97_02385 [Marispirochaeta aestuarii]